MNSDKQQAYTVLAMTAVSVSLTGLFFYQTFGLAMSLVSVLMQGAFMYFLPSMVRTNWAAAFLLLATMIVSIIASASILSNTVQEDELLVTERALLLSQIEATQRSIEGYLEREYITKAIPLRAELKELTEELNALPKTSDFYVAMSSIFGSQTSTAITLFVLIVSVMFDLGIVVLSLTSSQQVVVTESITTTPTPRPDNVVVLNDRQQVLKVVNALSSGKLKKPTVATVRDYLSCSQDRAMVINRLVKEQLRAAC